jgi:hypothetical protein
MDVHLLRQPRIHSETYNRQREIHAAGHGQRELVLKLRKLDEEAQTRLLVCAAAAMPDDLMYRRYSVPGEKTEASVRLDISHVLPEMNMVGVFVGEAVRANKFVMGYPFVVMRRSEFASLPVYFNTACEIKADFTRPGGTPLTIVGLPSAIGPNAMCVWRTNFEPNCSMDFVADACSHVMPDEPTPPVVQRARPRRGEATGGIRQTHAAFVVRPDDRMLEFAAEATLDVKAEGLRESKRLALGRSAAATGKPALTDQIVQFTTLRALRKNEEVLVPEYSPKFFENKCVHCCLCLFQAKHLVDCAVCARQFHSTCLGGANRPVGKWLCNLCALTHARDDPLASYVAMVRTRVSRYLGSFSIILPKQQYDTCVGRRTEQFKAAIAAPYANGQTFVELRASNFRVMAVFGAVSRVYHHLDPRENMMHDRMAIRVLRSIDYRVAKGEYGSWQFVSVPRANWLAAFPGDERAGARQLLRTLEGHCRDFAARVYSVAYMPDGTARVLFSLSSNVIELATMVDESEIHTVHAYTNNKSDITPDDAAEAYERAQN